MESVAQAIGKSSNAAQSLNHSDLMKQRVSCPSLDEYNNGCTFVYDLKYMIIHLNDEHKWSREDIADWLDTLENQPVFYPDIRTDDEKIEDAKKEVNQYHYSLDNYGPWTKSPQIVATSASVSFQLTEQSESIVLYNSNGSINNQFNGPGCNATWEVTFTPYGGASYVCVYDKSGSQHFYYPQPKSVTV